MEQYFLGDTVPRRPCLQPDTGEALAKERNGETTRSQLWLLRLGPWNHNYSFLLVLSPCKFHQIPFKFHFWDVFGFILFRVSSGIGVSFLSFLRALTEQPVQQPRSFGLPHHLPHRFCLRTMTRLNRTLHFPSQEIARCYVTLLLAWNMFFSPAFPPCIACSCAIFSAHSSGSACIALPAELLAFVDVLLHDTSL